MATLGVTAESLLVEHNASIKVRDGTVLRADVFRSGTPDRSPVLLVRTPYGDPGSRLLPVQRAIDAGFAVVVQHCRGTGTSDGTFVPFVNEADDAVDTIDWCANEIWSTGHVCMFGMSYSGMTQFAAAAHAPPGLVAFAPTVTPGDHHAGHVYNGGALELGQALAWNLMKAMQTTKYQAAAGDPFDAEVAELAEFATDFHRVYRHLPLRDVPGLNAISPFWRDWVEHEERDEYWSGLSYRDGRSSITVPAMHVGGWFDLFLSGTLDNFATLRAGAATAHARNTQRLIIGPWTHIDHSGLAGELLFGQGAAAAFDLEGKQIRFLADAAAGIETAEEAPISLFVMGDNVWRDEYEWPLARTRWERWHLRHNGELSPQSPDVDESPSSFVHDPAHPVPTTGGSTIMSGGQDGTPSWMPGPRDQRAVEARDDVLSFTSAVLDTAVEVTGPVSATLHAATTAADADFTARLVDVWPDGRALGVVDGIVRARYRNGAERAEPITPGTTYEFTIDLVATSWVFQAGHRIRVDVASSNFPRFDRNPGNGARIADVTEADFVTAEHTVFHAAQTPSYLTLPIIDR